MMEFSADEEAVKLAHNSNHGLGCAVVNQPLRLLFEALTNIRLKNTKWPIGFDMLMRSFFNDSMNLKISLNGKYSVPYDDTEIWHIGQIIKVLHETGNYIKYKACHAMMVVFPNASELQYLVISLFGNGTIFHYKGNLIVDLHQGAVKFSYLIDKQQDIMLTLVMMLKVYGVFNETEEKRRIVRLAILDEFKEGYMTEEHYCVDTVSILKKLGFVDDQHSSIISNMVVSCNRQQLNDMPTHPASVIRITILDSKLKTFTHRRVQILSTGSSIVSVATLVTHLQISFKIGTEAEFDPTRWLENSLTLIRLFHNDVQVEADPNLTRGRVILWEGWNDAMEYHEEATRGHSKIKFRAAAVSSLSGAMCKNGQFKRALKLFHNMVNGPDPPKYSMLSLGSFNVLDSSSSMDALVDELFE